MKNKFGFTLLEILLVISIIAVLAGIVIVAVNPAKQLGAARNAKRQADLGAVLGALYQYALDHDNLFPTSTDNTLRMIGTDTTGCAINCSEFANQNQDSSSANPATTLTDQNASDFGSGNYSNTYFDATGGFIKLSGGTSGNYTSAIKNAGDNMTVWNNFSWTTQRPIQKELPDNNKIENDFVAGNVNMSENVLLLHFNEPSGSNSFTDSSGNFNNTSCGTNVCPNIISGKFGNAPYFSKTANDYLVVKNSDSLTLTNKFSLEAWVNPSAWTGYGTALFKGSIYANYSLNLSSFSFWLNSYNNYWRIFLGKPGGGYSYQDFRYVPLNQWSHLVFTFDNGVGTTYLNGVLSPYTPTNTYSFSSVQTNSGDLVVGSAGADQFEGSIDEVAVYKRVLSANEVSDRYQRGISRLKLQVRSCVDETCSSNPSFIGPDGSSNTYFSGATNSVTLTGINGQFFQYKTILESDKAGVSPELKKVSIAYQTGVVEPETIGSFSSSTAESCLDLGPDLVSTYLSSIPYDPKIGTPNKTYYAVQKGQGGQIMLQACGAENGESIIVSR